MNPSENLIQPFGKAMELQQLKILSIIEYIPELGKLIQARSMRYYREPKSSEYPIDLSAGFADYIPLSNDQFFSNGFNKIIHFIKEQSNPLNMLEDITFCTNRGTLLILMHTTEIDRIYYLVATKIEGHIFLTIEDNTRPSLDQCMQLKNYYHVKLRQHLLVDQHGATPNTDKPVDERNCLYGIFSATLGDFKLMYSAELFGVENEQPLGDLSDPDVLKQCRFTATKVVRSDHRNATTFVYSWKKSYAHLAGIEHLHVGVYDQFGRITEPITVTQVDRLYGSISRRLQIMNCLLHTIKDYMTQVACAGVPHAFKLSNGTLNVCPVWVPTTNSTLPLDFINFMQEL